MLWMTAWLETRWRLAQIIALVVLALVMGETGGGLGSVEHARNLMGVLTFLSIFAAVNLAGAGINTQSSFRRTRGLHGSMYFTLSMPVSRFRLLAVRSGFGLLETTGINIIMIVSAWSLFSLVRGSSTFFDLLRLILAAIVCTACFYFVSVSMATVLDEIWQLYGSMFVIGTAWWVSSRFAPPSVNVFHFMGDASPLLTHRLPWPPMGVSLLTSVVLFLAALKIVETREY